MGPSGFGPESPAPEAGRMPSYPTNPLNGIFLNLMNLSILHEINKLDLFYVVWANRYTQAHLDKVGCPPWDRVDQ